MVSPTKSPGRIVDPDGTVHVGWFDGPFAETNLAEAPVRHLLSPLRGTSLAFVERAYRRWRLKRWHYTSVVTDRVFFACAVVDLGYVGNAFAYVVDRQTGEKHEHNALAPLGRGLSMAESSTDGRTVFNKPGWGQIVLDNDSAAGLRKVAVELEGQLGPAKQPPLEARYEIRDAGSDPAALIIVEESEPRRWLYTHKCYGLEAGGSVRSGNIADEVALGQGNAGLDFNCGYRPRQTWWNWAAAGGQANGGERIGFNLTAHRPWLGAPGAPAGRGSSDEADAGDCALWLPGRCVKIRRVEFEYDLGDMLKTWWLRDDAGLVDLRFEPMGQRQDDVNLGLMVSQFHQPYGTFSGTLRSPEGEVFELSDLFGVTEQHYALW
jgi:hypothetical protein